MTTKKPTPAEITAAATGRPLVLARDAERGMLLPYKVDGEDVGIEIRHVEPSGDGEKVLIVLTGGATQWYAVDEEMPVVHPDDARAADERLRIRRRRAKQAADLRSIADVIEGTDILMPHTLRLQGSVSTLEELVALSEALGAEAPQQTSSEHWYFEHYFGAEDKYLNPVELHVSLYIREQGAGR